MTLIGLHHRAGSVGRTMAAVPAETAGYYRVIDGSSRNESGFFMNYPGMHRL